MLKLNAALIALQLAYGFILGTSAVEAQPSETGQQSPAVSAAVALDRQNAPPAEAQAPAVASSDLTPSPQAEQVSRIAERNGDKNYLLVDKIRGEIFLFEGGKPIISGAALTGASSADRIPPKVLTFADSHPLSPEQKVTPAGRFTVRQEADPEYGRVLTLNEIHGKDWDIAVHGVYLGIPSEHRDVRLHSSNVDDRHITFGCINVERSTILLLTRTLPRKGKIPIYIMPRDEAMTAAFFPLRDSPPTAAKTN